MLPLRVLLSEDVPGAANKLIALKSEFPKADVFSIMASRPKTLLQPEEKLVGNAQKVGPWYPCFFLLVFSVCFLNAGVKTDTACG